jgi:hypothetical protein
LIFQTKPKEIICEKGIFPRILHFLKHHLPSSPINIRVFPAKNEVWNLLLNLQWKEGSKKKIFIWWKFFFFFKEMPAVLQALQTCDGAISTIGCVINYFKEVKKKKISFKNFFSS